MAPKPTFSIDDLEANYQATMQTQAQAEVDLDALEQGYSAQGTNLAQLQAIQDEARQSALLDPMTSEQLMQQAMAAEYAQQPSGLMDRLGGIGQAAWTGVKGAFDLPISFGREYLGTFDDGTVYNPITGQSRDINETASEAALVSGQPQSYGPTSALFNAATDLLSPISPERFALAGQRMGQNMYQDLSRAFSGPEGGSLGAQVGTEAAVNLVGQRATNVPMLQPLKIALPAVQAIAGVAAREYADGDDIAQQEPSMLRRMVERTVELYSEYFTGKGTEKVADKLRGASSGASRYTDRLTQSAESEIAGLKPVDLRKGVVHPYDKPSKPRELTKQLDDAQVRAQRIATGADSAVWRTDHTKSILRRNGFFDRPESARGQMDRLLKLEQAALNTRKQVLSELPGQGRPTWQSAVEGVLDPVTPRKRHPQLATAIADAQLSKNIEELNALRQVAKDIDNATTPAGSRMQIEGAIQRGYISRKQAKLFKPQTKTLVVSSLDDPQLKGASRIVELADGVQLPGQKKVSATFPPEATPPIFQPMDRLAELRTKYGKMADGKFVKGDKNITDVQKDVAEKAYRWTTQLMEDYAAKLVKSGKLTDAQWQALSNSYDLLHARQVLFAPIKAKAAIEDLPFYSPSTIMGPGIRQSLRTKAAGSLSRAIVNNPTGVATTVGTAAAGLTGMGGMIKPFSMMAQNPYVLTGQLALREGSEEPKFPRTSEQFFSLPDDLLGKYFPDKLSDIQKLRNAEPGLKHAKLREWADDPEFASMLKPSIPGLERYNLIDGVMTAASARQADEDLRVLMSESGSDRIKIANLRRVINANRPIITQDGGYSPIDESLAQQIISAPQLDTEEQD